MYNNHGPRTMGHQSRILDPGSRTLDPGSHIMDPGSWNVDPGSGVLDLGHIIILFEIIHYYTTKLRVAMCPYMPTTPAGCTWLQGGSIAWPSLQHSSRRRLRPIAWGLAAHTCIYKFVCRHGTSTSAQGLINPGQKHIQTQYLRVNTKHVQQYWAMLG